MKKTLILKVFNIVLLLTSNISMLCTSGLTNNTWSGRLGDQLIIYSKAKWLSYKYELDFFLQPFQHSNRLKLYFNEKNINQARFRKKITLKNEGDITTNQNESTLYKCHFFCHLENELFEEIVKNEEFSRTLKTLIKPTSEATNLKLPQDIITVAIHIRKGHHDHPLISEQIYDVKKDLYKQHPQQLDKKRTYADKAWPLKFPPEQFYIDQLKTLYTLLNKQNLYVFIFTDQDPIKIINNFKKQSPSNIKFHCHDKNENIVDENLINDMFNMSTFDCLIRPDSSYSTIAQFIGSHKVIIEPIKSYWKNNRLIISHARATIPDYKNKTTHYFSHKKNNVPLKNLLEFQFFHQ